MEFKIGFGQGFKSFVDSKPLVRALHLCINILFLGLLSNCGLVFNYLIVEEGHENLVRLDSRYFIEESEYTGRVFSEYPDSSLKRIKVYKKGRLHGSQVSWHENGRVSSMQYFDRGVPTGEQKFWFDTGVLRSRVFYKNGRKEGLSLEWNSQGQVLKEENWINGSLVYQKIYNSTS